MRRLDLGPEVNIAVTESFAVGVGFHGLIEGLKRRSRRDEFDRQALNEIVTTAPTVVDGLREAGEYLDPASVSSGSTPTWA